MYSGGAEAASEASWSVLHLSLPVCARRHGEIQCKLLSSMEEAQFLFTALCPRMLATAGLLQLLYLSRVSCRPSNPCWLLQVLARLLILSIRFV